LPVPRGIHGCLTSWVTFFLRFPYGLTIHVAYWQRVIARPAATRPATRIGTPLRRASRLAGCLACLTFTIPRRTIQKRYFGPPRKHWTVHLIPFRRTSRGWGFNPLMKDRSWLSCCLDHLVSLEVLACLVDYINSATWFT
jgi:hypothetical protein